MTTKFVQPEAVDSETLEKWFDEFAKIPKNKRVNVGRIKKRFLWWPRWTPDDEIYAWFDKMYPDGLLGLMKKRMAKKYGEDYVNNWDNIERPMKKVSLSYFISTPPDLARTREYQAKRHGQIVRSPSENSIPDILTEEDKKRLLQEFATEG